MGVLGLPPGKEEGSPLFCLGLNVYHFSYLGNSHFHVPLVFHKAYVSIFYLEDTLLSFGVVEFPRG